MSERSDRSKAKRDKVSNYKLTVGCMRCGIRRLPAEDYDMDHLPGEVKLENVSDLCSQDASWKRISAEMNKCQVLCKGCHREVTAERISGNDGRNADADLLVQDALIRYGGARTLVSAREIVDVLLDIQQALA